MTKSLSRMGSKTTARSVSPGRGRTLDTLNLPDFIMSILSEQIPIQRDRIDRIDMMKILCDFGIRNLQSNPFSNSEPTLTVRTLLDSRGRDQSRSVGRRRGTVQRFGSSSCVIPEKRVAPETTRCGSRPGCDMGEERRPRMPHDAVLGGGRPAGADVALAATGPARPGAGDSAPAEVRRVLPRRAVRMRSRKTHRLGFIGRGTGTLDPVGDDRRGRAGLPAHALATAVGVVAIGFVQAVAVGRATSGPLQGVSAGRSVSSTAASGRPCGAG